MKDPAQLTHADRVMMEGTMATATIARWTTRSRNWARSSPTLARGGNVMIPSFAVGRTQEILFHLGRLHQQGTLDNWQIFLDSPMAIKADTTVRPLVQAA